MSSPHRDAAPAHRRRVGAVVVAVAVAVPLSVGSAAPAGAAVTSGPAAPAPVAVAGRATDLPTPVPSVDESKRRADEILSRPDYQETPGSVVDRVLAWIVERLSDLLSRFGGAGGKGANPLAWVLVAVLFGMIVFLVTRWRGARGVRRETDPLFVTEVEARRTATEWLQEARRLEGERRWKDALRCRFRALILELVERGVVTDVPGRTTGEFRVEVARRSPGLAEPFAAASSLFDAAWYGDEPTGPAENERFQHLAGEILTGAGV